MDRNTQVLVKVSILKLNSACNFLLNKPQGPSIYTPISSRLAVQDGLAKFENVLK